MRFDIEEIVAKWEKEEPIYRKLGELLFPKMKDAIREHEIFPEIQYRVKDLLSIVRKLKKKNKTEEYAYADLTDKLGFRIICAFTDELDVVEKFIQSTFEVVKVDKKREQLDYHTLGYISNHYDVKVTGELKQYHDLTFEIQVKTLNQHTWSNTSHALSYKQEAKLSDEQRRKIFRLLALYEIADDEFMLVNSSLKEDESNLVYAILRKIEGKIYKYAKVDFDRETSLQTLNILIGYFTEEQVGVIMREINSFIEENDERIKAIFRDNRDRFHEIPILTQPEIFLIWFALENFEFSIDDNWNNDFDPNELVQIKVLWGEWV